MASGAFQESNQILFGVATANQNERAPPATAPTCNRSVMKKQHYKTADGCSVGSLVIRSRMPGLPRHFSGLYITLLITGPLL
ncbi:hypothetical protein [Nitrobacter sp. TKz-YC01]|uniref:hypothetical protein n=1 Tax=Nitrobacter sp. TKz-YC01 TaxID=3398703 RepID=UPI003A0FF86B